MPYVSGTPAIASSGIRLDPSIGAPPDPDQVSRVVGLLREARRPALVAGTTVWWSHAERELVALQDSLMPIEVGDPELRAGLTEVRQLIAPLPARARDLLRLLGR